MDSKNKENKIWVEKLISEVQVAQIEEALADRGLRAEEIRLLPRGRAVLIFEQKSDAAACLKERDVFRHLGCTADSWAHLMKYQPGFEDSMFRGQSNLIEERLSKDIYDVFLRSREPLTSLTEQYKITWFYSALYGLYLRGPAEPVKQVSRYLRNSESRQDCERNKAVASKSACNHNDNFVQFKDNPKNKPTQVGRNGCSPPRRSLVLQPEGEMVAQVNKKKCLPGHKNCGTIVITYDFPAGVQGEDHPRPGRPYSAQTFTTYVPDLVEGRAVVKLLKKAFDQKLLFVIMWLTEKDKIVLKECVRHKLKVNGGVEHNGYPDPGYLAAVKKDLAAIGIK